MGSQNSCDCDCSTSHLTANTGIVNVSAPNPFLDGTGTLSTVLTAGENGTIIKSIIIKAMQPVTTGMVRLFISNNSGSEISLYREIPIPTFPETTFTPTPPPIWPTIEIVLIDGLKLQPTFKLLASTQTAQTFIVIAEGMDWNYPTTLPEACCNFIQEKATTGLGTASAPNTALDGTGNITAIYTVPGSVNGGQIKSVTIAALQSTSKGMVRLFLSPDGINYHLMTEIMIPETNQSGFIPSYKQSIDLNFSLKTGYTLGASTQIAESFACTVEAETWTYPFS